jgi:hypothetical protein
MGAMFDQPSSTTTSASVEKISTATATSSQKVQIHLGVVALPIILSQPKYSLLRAVATFKPVLVINKAEIKCYITCNLLLRNVLRERDFLVNGFFYLTGLGGRKSDYMKIYRIQFPPALCPFILILFTGYLFFPFHW